MEPLALNKKVTAHILKAHEEEIKRISFELHDGIAQTLYSIYTGLQFVHHKATDPELKKYTQDMIQLTERTVDELRWVSTELRPQALDALGLLPALNSYRKVFTATFGILVDIEIHGNPRRLSEYKEIALFRVCQEIMYNAAKYADSERIAIDFYWDEDQLKIVIQDFGRGFDVVEVMNSGASLGIMAVKQRIELLDGVFDISSCIGCGTTVKVAIPV